MKRSRRSAVWNHFQLISDKEVQCNICQKTLKFNNSTSSLSYHLNSAHSTERGEGITERNEKFCDPLKSEAITKKICNMISMDMLPINVVDGQGFQELIMFIEPGYLIPSRTTFTSLLEVEHAKKKEELKKCLSASNVSLTTDCWTSLNNESYITVTFHTITSEWRLFSGVLLTDNMAEKHTAENLAETLKKSVETWGLTGRVIACVHDNARNMVSANSPNRVDWKSVPCFAHTLQLAINDGFSDDFNEAIVSAKRLVQHFNHSGPACNALASKQSLLHLPSHKLVQSCRTRWNSVVDMFKRLTEQRWAVSAVLSDRSVTRPKDARTLELKEEQWQLMEDVAPVLETLKCATTIMSSEGQVSISDTHPIVFSLIKKHLNIEHGDETIVGQFKQKVSASLTERMK
ncbi:zinc finger BED domain-containing protein 1, partial [Caligus rogercresseyi]